MRPVRLIMQAFGAYPSRQTVDFRELGQRGFVLITGPTGSGKTTVLDAICFALYGVASGSEREPRGMRSHHADAAVPTLVELDFTVGGHPYKVRRSLDHEVDRRKTPLKADATLWDMEGADIDREGTVLETGITNVTKYVSSLLGLADRQFRQVIMLPQGQFRQALTADSGDRQEIFQLLFDTERYCKVEEALQVSAAEIRAELKDVGAAIRADLGRVGAGSEEELDTILAAQADMCEQAQNAERAAAEAAAAADQALKEGEKAAAVHAEVAAALQQLAEEEARAADIDLLKSELALAQAAAACVQVDEALRDADGELRRAEVEHEEALAAANDARLTQETAAVQLETERGPQRAAARSAAQRLVVQLEQLREAVRQIETAREAAIMRRSELDAAARASEQSTAALTDIVAHRSKLERERGDCAVLAAGAAAFERDLENARAALERAAKIESIMRKLRVAERKAEAEGAASEAAVAGMKAARARLDQLRAAMTQGYAAALASALTDGEPCPVCGSMDHPAPARPAQGQQLVTEEQLAEAEQEVTQATAEAEKAAATFDAARLAVSELRGQAQALEEAGGAASTAAHTTAAAVAELEAAKRAAQQGLERANRAAARLVEIDAELSAVAEKVSQAELEQKRCAEALMEATIKNAAADADLAARCERVPVDLRSAQALGDALEAAEREKAGLEGALAAAESDHEQASRALGEAESALRVAEARLTGATERRDTAIRKLDAAVKKAGFRDVDHYRESLRSPEWMDEIRRAVADYDAKLVASRRRAAAAQAAAEGVARPDMDGLLAARAAAVEAERLAMTATAQARARRGELERAAGILRGHLDERKALEEHYAVANRVAEVAAGRAPNRLGMNFERFVLASMLDQVAEAATVRLQVMSRGRYVLRRTGQRKTVRSKAGLELEVYDRHTGRERAVSTLSGGEGFMAALSLALGLSDVVQARSGGIRLDTMFIDEGFGSLDAESLDLAIDTLMDLQRNGGRLIGIISHVPELAERIDARLEVIPTEKGSRARFVVG